MRQYEVMVILDAGLEEDAIRATLDRATKSLSEQRCDRWQGGPVGQATLRLRGQPSE